jgi:hypothetical protein
MKRHATRDARDTLRKSFAAHVARLLRSYVEAYARKKKSAPSRSPFSPLAHGGNGVAWESAWLDE